jgi:hypothetical protein
MNENFSQVIQEASFDVQSNMLSIPALKVGNDLFSLELTLINSEPVELQLTSLQKLESTFAIATATFESGTILIPSLIVGGTKYRAEFSLISDNPITLRLSSAVAL